MRIGIDARPLQRERSRWRGIMYYISNLLEHLARLDDKNEYVLYTLEGAPPPLARPFARQRWQAIRTLRLRPLARLWPQLYRRLLLPERLEWLGDAVFWPRAAQESRADIVHATAMCQIRPRSGYRVVATAYDLIPLIYDRQMGFHRMPPDARFGWARHYRLVAQADKLIAISHSTRKDLVRILGVPEEKVAVIYLAAGERFRPVTDGAEVGRVLAKYGLEGPFLLYVGGFDFRKNVPRLLEAYAALLEMTCEGPPLVMAGSPGTPEDMNNLEGAVKGLGLQGKVARVGFVPDEDLPALYSGCRAFVFPSLYEGFGLPVLEAMACGAPVICSNSSSLPEVAGDAALLVDPADTAAWARAMYALLGQEALRRELRAKGLARAQVFSWHRAAELTLQAYEEVARWAKREALGCALR